MQVTSSTGATAASSRRLYSGGRASCRRLLLLLLLLRCGSGSLPLGGVPRLHAAATTYANGRWAALKALRSKARQPAAAAVVVLLLRAAAEMSPAALNVQSGRRPPVLQRSAT